MRTSFSLLCLIGLAASCPAATGGPYTITSDDFSSAGGRATSAVYQDDTSTGGTGTEKTGSPSYDAASGQSSTLRNVVSLTPGPRKIPEGAATTLGLYELLDDGTLTSISSTGAVWSKISGPLTLSASGVATTQAVFADQTAQVQLTLNSVVTSGSITVENTLTDNFGSYAADGLPDDWQVLYFGQNNPQAAPTQDPDGDGQDNKFEYNAGLLPTSPSSRLSVILQPVPGQPGQVRVACSPATAGHTFTLLKTASLTSPNWQPVPGVSLNGNGGTLLLADPASADTRAFYQVRISTP